VSEEKTNQLYISDVIDPSDFVKDKFNLIASGCGTGKSRFVARTLLSKMPDVKPYEVILVTSRSLTVAQQSRDDGMSRYDKSNENVVKFWNAESDDVDHVIDSGIQVMTYDKIINLIRNYNPCNGETLERIKVIVLDECHALFSDVFIKGMGELRQWIRRTIDFGGKYIIGMTATPEIMYSYGSARGFTINQVNKTVISGYRAKKMIATNFETIPYLIASGKLTGKTLIMCATVKDCEKLKAEIPNSAILISQNNPGYKHEMDLIREKIVSEETLPDYYYERLPDGSLEQRELNVLITTSTAREGFNLRPESGVKNIVCCLADPLHVTQFAGRARYDLDKIVVADTYIALDKFNKDSYIATQRRMFKEFLYNKQNIMWFKSVAHLVTHDVYGVKRFVLNSDENRFISYINKKWLVPIDATKIDLESRKIWRDDDKREIIDVFKRCRLVDKSDADITFNRVVSMLESCLGYKVNSGRQVFDNERRTYKLIVSFDEEKVTYQKAIPPLDEDEEELIV